MPYLGELGHLRRIGSLLKAVEDKKPEGVEVQILSPTPSLDGLSDRAHIWPVPVSPPERLEVEAMFRRLLVLPAVLVMMLVMATPASATITQTQNIHGAFAPFHVDAKCSAPAGTIFGTGNAVFHITINNAGDTWITSTQEEDFTFVPDVGTLTATGHFVVWFGVSVNNQNEVLHDVFNVRGTFSDGTPLTFHAVDHLSVSASGQVNLFMTCS